LSRRSWLAEDNILWVRSTPFDPAFREEGYLDNSLREDLQALRSVPGVRAATNTFCLPWQGGGSSTELRAAHSKGEFLRTQVYGVDEGAFPTLGVGLTGGRDLTPRAVETCGQRVRPRPEAPRANGAVAEPQRPTVLGPA